MEDDGRMAREALKANGLTPGESSEEKLAALQKEIARLRRGLNRLKWFIAAVFGLAIVSGPVFAYLAGRAALRSGFGEPVRGGSAIQPVLYILGLLAVGLYMARWYVISRMEQRASLERISIQLEKLTEKSQEQ